MNYELQANKYNRTVIGLTAIFIFATLVANELGLFIVAHHLMRTACIPVILLLVISYIFLLRCNMEKRWIKYYVVMIEALCIFYMGIFITYHMLLFYSVPYIMAAQYHEKKISNILFYVTCVGVIVNILLGYQFGICDMNMVAITADNLSSYGPNGDTLEFPIQYMNTKVAIDLLIFYGIPRIGTCLILFKMSNDLTKTGLQKEQLAEKVTYEGTHDQMTGLFNNNKYLQTITELSKISDEKIGVMFFDINNLKYVNDTMSHEMGDKLICMAAKSLSYASSNKSSVYRIGGDEFVLIIRDCTKVDIKATMKVWEHALELINEAETKLQCSMASGYALGSAEDINNLVKEADAKMYLNKRNYKKK